jgi:hypothetical protein
MMMMVVMAMPVKQARYNPAIAVVMMMVVMMMVLDKLDISIR